MKNLFLYLIITFQFLSSHSITDARGKWVVRRDGSSPLKGIILITKLKEMGWDDENARSFEKLSNENRIQYLINYPKMPMYGARRKLEASAKVPLSQTEISDILPLIKSFIPRERENTLYEDYIYKNNPASAPGRFAKDNLENMHFFTHKTQNSFIERRLQKGSLIFNAEKVEPEDGERVYKFLKKYTSLTELTIKDLTVKNIPVIEFALQKLHQENVEFKINKLIIIFRRFYSSGPEETAQVFSNSKILPSCKKLMPHLEILEISFILDNKGIKQVSQFQNLIALSILLDERTMLDLNPLKLLKNIRSLKLYNGVINENNALALTQMSQLQKLELVDCKIQPKALEQITQIKNIKELCLEDSDIQLAGIKKVSTMKQLERLSVRGCDVTNVREDSSDDDRYDDRDQDSLLQVQDEAIKAVQALTNLKELDISKNDIGDTGAEGIKQLNKLSELNVSYNYMTSQGAILISQMKNLNKLYIDGNYIGDEGLAAISTMPNIKELSVMNTKLSDAGFLSICKMKMLKKIRYDSWELYHVTDETRKIFEKFLREKNIEILHSAERFGYWGDF